VQRPSHSTIVAYLALFLALCTGAAFAATKIKSSKQIKRGVVNSGDVKDAGLSGKDIADGGLTGDDLANGSLAGAKIEDGSLTGADLLDGSITGAELADASVPGGKLAPDSVTGDEVDESSLDLARGFSALQTGSEPVDNGIGAIPRSPEGRVVALALPPGRYAITARAVMGATADVTGGYFCQFGSIGDYVPTAGYVSNVDFDDLPVTPSGLSATTIRESDVNFLTELICSDANTGLRVSNGEIVAIKLRD
jgi:hypothetical protein